ncbi:MAG: carbohydrate kinase family protein [Pseudolabrys sp.]|nr:carbohydrate kinase family protein [Pseudolabrys sp.]
MRDVAVICVGGAKVDLNALVDAFPTQDSRTLVEHLYDGIGGQAITAAVAIARLGVPVAYCGVIGCDAPGDTIMQRLEDEGIATDWVERRADVHTSRSSNIVTRGAGTRAIVTERAPSPDLSRMPPLKAQYVHFDDVGHEKVRSLRGIVSKGVKISIDAGNPVPDLKLAEIDLYAPTMARLAADYGAARPPRQLLQCAIDDGAGEVVATDGARGSYLLSSGDFRHVPGFTVDIVSTLGAGDVFHGAILAAICLDKPLPEVLLWGNACAALSCRAVDGQSMAPRRDELEAFLAMNTKSPPMATALGAT